MRIAPISFGAWAQAFCLTIAVEIPVVMALTRAAEPRPWRRAALAMAGNLVTHPAVWYLFPALGLGWGATTTLSESWAWLAEGVVYRFGLSQTGWRSALGVSFVANLASFGLGLALWALGLWR